MRPLIALLLIGFGSLLAAPVPKELRAKKGDTTLIVGRWRPSDGTKQWYEFKADGTMKTWNEPDEGRAVPYRWTMDPTVTPKRMTWTGGRSGRVEYEAVYELDGNSLWMTYAAAPRVPTTVDRMPGPLTNGLTRDTPAK